MNKKVEDVKKVAETKMDKKVDLKSEVLSLKKKLMVLRMKNSSGSLEKTSEIRKTKKRIAQILTKISKKG